MFTGQSIELQRYIQFKNWQRKKLKKNTSNQQEVKRRWPNTGIVLKEEKKKSFYLELRSLNLIGKERKRSKWKITLKVWDTRLKNDKLNSCEWMLLAQQQAIYIYTQKDMAYNNKQIGNNPKNLRNKIDLELQQRQHTNGLTVTNCWWKQVMVQHNAHQRLAKLATHHIECALSYSRSLCNSFFFVLWSYRLESVCILYKNISIILDMFFFDSFYVNNSIVFKTCQEMA